MEISGCFSLFRVALYHFSPIHVVLMQEKLAKANIIFLWHCDFFWIFSTTVASAPLLEALVPLLRLQAILKKLNKLTST